jgi:hypothetical protein
MNNDVSAVIAFRPDGCAERHLTDDPTQRRR